MWRAEFDDVYVLDVRKNDRAGWPALSVFLTPAPGNSCTADVCYDADPLAPAAQWLEWPKGSISVQTIDSCEGPITGVRCRRVTGAASGNNVTIYGGVAKGWQSEPPMKGEPGADSTVPGPQGIQGLQGIQGAPGGANIYGARKVAAQTFTGNIFLNVTDLAFPVKSGETWSFEAYMSAGCSGAAGGNFSITTPGGSAKRFQVFGNAGAAGAFTQGNGTVDDVVVQAVVAANAQGRLVQMTGVVVAGADGDVRLRCRSVNAAQIVTVDENSYLVARQHGAAPSGPSFAQGVVQWSVGSTGQTIVSGLSFQPKAVVLFSINPVGNFKQFSAGVSVAPVAPQSSFTVATPSGDSTIGGWQFSFNKVMSYYLLDGSYVQEADVTAYNSDGFTLTFTQSGSPPSSETVQLGWLALG